MPAGDGSGPQGMGPMTGRAAGFCAGYNAPGYMNGIPRGGMGRGFGRGFGRGMGFGRGGGRGFGARWGAAPGWYGGGYNRPVPPSRDQEMDMLKNEAEYVENELKQIRARMEELESSTQGK